jgi:hypothetical protein
MKSSRCRQVSAYIVVIHAQFERAGKKLVWQAVFSDITPTSFTQTGFIGEPGGPLNRVVTIQATKMASAPVLVHRPIQSIHKPDSDAQNRSLVGKFSGTA